MAMYVVTLSVKEIEEHTYRLENARHCGASLSEYTCRTWNSYMHMTVIRM